MHLGSMQRNASFEQYKLAFVKGKNTVLSCYRSFRHDVSQIIPWNFAVFVIFALFTSAFVINQMSYFYTLAPSDNRVSFCQC